MPKHPSRRASRSSFAAERLESRRLLAGQIFAGEGPVVDSLAQAAASADFNNDGRADLVAGLAGPDVFGVSIQLSTGDGRFTKTAVAATSSVYALTIGDFNNDGRPDIAAGTVAGVTIVTVKPDGTVDTITANTSAGPSFQLVTGDFNADGKLDLATSRYLSNTVPGEGVKVLLGNGNGTFASPITYPTPSTGVLAAADFNNDGRTDLATANPADDNGVAILLSTGTGSFTAAPTLATPTTNIPALVTGDFNNDNKADLVAGSKLFYGLGDGTFDSNSVNVSASSYAVGDVDGNGRRDLIGLSSYTSFNADGTITRTTTNAAITVNAFVGIAADFTGDGKVDLAQPERNRYMVSVLLNTGANSFGTRPVTVTGSATANGDFNNDGKTDIVVTSQPTFDTITSYVRPGNGDGTFGNPIEVPAANNLRSVVTGDFNGDGLVDLAGYVLNSPSLYIVPGVGNGQFTATPIAVPLGVLPYGLHAADVNSDGKTDLLTYNTNGSSFSVVLGTIGTFGATTVPLPAGPTGIASGDFNGDGKLDLGIAGRNSTPNASTVMVLLGLGNGTFGAASVLTGVAPNASDIAAADLNNDGRADLAVSNVYTTQTGYLGQTVSILLGQGDGTFTAAPQVTVVPDPSSLRIGDFNNDGKPDLLAAGFHPALSPAQVDKYNGPAVAIALGRGDGTFAPTTRLNGYSGLGTPADFNNDGKLDVIAATNSNAHAVLLNQYSVDATVGLSDGVVSVSGVTGPIVVSLGGGVLSVATPTGTQTFPAATVSGLVLSGVNALIQSDLDGRSLTVGTAATATFNANQHLAALTVSGTATLPAGGARLVKTAALAFGPVGKLDLNDNGLIYDYSGASPADAVRSLIAGGRANGAWTGHGLTSTAARSRVGKNTTLGYLEASTSKSLRAPNATFRGESLDDTAIVIQYVLYGDIDLDGGVSINDFNRLSSNFGRPTNRTWADGDLSYDAGVGIDDFNLLAANFGLTLPPVAVVPTIKKGVAPAKR